MNRREFIGGMAAAGAAAAPGAAMGVSSASIRL